MLLAIDVGNTQTALGLFDGESLAEHRRLATDASRTGDELGALLGEMLDLESVDGICLSSTVPAQIREFELFAERWAKAPILVVEPGVRTGIPMRHDAPHQVGPDRIVNSVAAKERYGAPCIVVDFGTSTNFDVVSPQGEYVGGVLAPGIEISMEALFVRAARLTKVDLAEPPSAIGKTTEQALQSGLVYGFAGQVDRIVEEIRRELGAEARAVATGGLADLVVPHSRTIELVDPWLTLEGLRLVWDAEQPVTDAELRAWMDAYTVAFNAQDSRAAAQLFTEDATYQWGPFGKRLVGRQEIHDEWEAHSDSEEVAEMRYEVIAVTQDVGVTRWIASHTSERRVHRMDGVFVVTLTEDGLCDSFREWWHSPGGSALAAAVDRDREIE